MRYDPIGYTWNADAYCPQCLPETKHQPNEHGETPYPIFSWDEFYTENDDGTYSPYTCGHCHNPIK